MTLIYTPSPGTTCHPLPPGERGNKVEILNQVQDDTLLTFGDDIEWMSGKT